MGKNRNKRKLKNKTNSVKNPGEGIIDKNKLSNALRGEIATASKNNIASDQVCSKKSKQHSADQIYRGNRNLIRIFCS